MTRVCWEQLGSVGRQAGREDSMKLDPNEEHLQGVRKEVTEREECGGGLRRLVTAVSATRPHC